MGWKLVRRAVAAVPPGLLVLSSASALEIGGDLTVGLAATNNVELAPSGQEQDDQILRVAPTLLAYHESERVDFAFEGTLEGLFYRDDSDRDQVNTELYSNLLYDLIKDRIGWRGLASLSQINVNPDGPLSNTNLFDTGNRDDAFIWETGPEWTSPIFSQSDLRVVGYGGEVNYGDSNLQDIQTRYVEASIEQRALAVSTFGLEVFYRYERFDYDDAGDVEDQNIYTQLSYQYTDTLRLFGLVGADNDFENPGSSSLDEFRWETGFAAEVVGDTFEAAVGERYFGTTWRAAWNRVREDQRYRVSYRQAPANTDFLSYRALQRGELDDFQQPPASANDGRPGVGDRYILDRLDGRAELELPNSLFYFEGFWQRQDREEGNRVEEPNSTILTGDEDLWGGEARVTWEVGYRTTANTGFYYRNRKSKRYNANGTSAGHTSDELYRIYAGLGYALGEKTTLDLTVLYDKRDGSGGTVADYDQLGAILEITREFGDLDRERFLQ